VDQPPSYIGLLVAFCLVLVNGFFVAAEFAIVKVRQTRLAELANEGNRLAPRAQRITARLDAYLAATQLGITIASLGLGWIGEPAVAALIEEPLARLGLGETAIEVIAFGLAFSFITILHITLGELAPKSLAILRPERTALVVAWPLDVFYFVMRPAIVLLNGTANLLLRLVGVNPATESEAAHSDVELRLLLASSGEHGVIDPIEQELASRSLTLGDLSVRDVMVPRTALDAIPINSSGEEARREALTLRRSRLPVYDDSLDDIRGVIEWPDLFAEPVTGWIARIKPVLVLPETIPASLALRRLLDAHTDVALVLDEYGGTAGLLTYRDLVGEVAQREVLSAGHLAGDTPVHLVEESLAIDMGDSEATTIGGYLAERLRRIPLPGDEVEVGEWRFRVIESDGHHVLQVAATRKA
jgi:CBS domain containing-hemolysin-like protein